MKVAFLRCPVAMPNMTREINATSRVSEGISEKTHAKRLNFADTLTYLRFKYFWNCLGKNYELCTCSAFATALNPADGPHIYGHHRVHNLDSSRHIFWRADPSDVYRSGVDTDLPIPRGSTAALRLAQTPLRP
tara:strand:- start:177 stop:575 length:399 start_codon:yes stop_codon:yes gene_type:complete